MHFLSAPAPIVAGLTIDSAQRKDEDEPIRFLSIISAACFAMLSISAAGVSMNMRLEVIVGVAAQAVPLGVLYPLVTELFFSWLPEASGTAVGLGQLSFGFGSIFTARSYNILTQRCGVEQVLCVSAILVALASSTPRLYISGNPSSKKETFEEIDETQERHLLETSQNDRLPCTKLITPHTFWLYIVIILIAGASYAFIPY